MVLLCASQTKYVGVWDVSLGNEVWYFHVFDVIFMFAQANNRQIGVLMFYMSFSRGLGLLIWSC